MRFRVSPATAAALTVVAALVGGCSAQPLQSDRPNWSLADKPPAQLGAQLPASGTPAEPTIPQQTYEYRGGRDPVTGQARAVGSAPAGASPSPANPIQAANTIEVRQGDTLHGLSLTHHVSVKALMAANKLSTTTIRPGQKLIVPQG